MRELSLSGAIPGNDLNGLLGMAEDLIKNPAETRVVICLLDVASIKTKVDDGTSMPTVRLRAIEPITDPKRAASVRQVMNDLYVQRTGKVELDLDYDHSYDDEDGE